MQITGSLYLLVVSNLVFVCSTSIAYSVPITHSVSAIGVCKGALAPNGGTGGAARWTIGI